MILLTVAHACPLRTVRILTLSHGRSRFATNGDANAVPPRATRTFRLAMLIAISRALDHYEQYQRGRPCKGQPAAAVLAEQLESRYRPQARPTIVPQAPRVSQQCVLALGIQFAHELPASSLARPHKGSAKSGPLFLTLPHRSDVCARNPLTSGHVRA